jgi:DNA-nicking Smr family endonuclease
MTLNSHKQRAIRKGKLRAEAVIDLHGMRGHEAREACEAFMEAAIERDLRAVQIITGKGDVLREALPRWLEAPKIHPHILAIQHALPNEGGSGAFLILLKRKLALS